jgi:hypothetical protein
MSGSWINILKLSTLLMQNSSNMSSVFQSLFVSIVIMMKSKYTLSGMLFIGRNYEEQIAITRKYQSLLYFIMLENLV